MVCRPGFSMKVFNELMRSRWLFHLGAVALTYIYWWSALTKLWEFSAAEAEMPHFGLQPAAFFASATIVLQLGGAGLIICGGRFAWLGAGALALFTLATIPLAHDYWNMTGGQAFAEKNLAQEHITVVGGLVLAAIAAHMRRISPQS